MKLLLYFAFTALMVVPVYGQTQTELYRQMDSLAKLIPTPPPNCANISNDGIIIKRSDGSAKYFYEGEWIELKSDYDPCPFVTVKTHPFVTVQDFLDYQTECWNDSTIWVDGAVYDTLWHYHFIKHYDHRPPTFEGFINYLRRKYK